MSAPAKPRRRTFSVTPEADKVYRCARCGRRLRTGMRVTLIRSANEAEARHAGRKCPPLYS